MKFSPDAELFFTSFILLHIPKSDNMLQCQQVNSRPAGKVSASSVQLDQTSDPSGCFCFSGGAGISAVATAISVSPGFELMHIMTVVSPLLRSF